MATALATADQGDPQAPTHQGNLTPQQQHFQLMQRKAALFAKSPLIPDTLRAGGEQQALANCYIGLTMAEAMGENPLTVLQNIHVVKGKAGFSAQFMIARANASGVFAGRIDWRIEGQGEKLAVTAFAHLAYTRQEVSVTCDMAMAKAEGWTSNPKYKSMPEVMLRYRSATFLVRFYAPDVMFGFQTREEVEDIVAAGAPDLAARPALSAGMLIAQASPAENDAAVVEEKAEPIEAEPVEPINEEPEIDAQEAMADDIIRRAGKTSTIVDLNRLEQEVAGHVAALDDGLAEACAKAITGARMRLTGKGE